MHDYSKNWDFDGDCILDQLFFVGTGGAHLYYYPRIILSSDKVVREFRRIEIDFPVLQIVNPSEDSSKFLKNLIGFAVFDCDDKGENTFDLVIRLDKQSKTNYFKKPEVHSGVLIITFDGTLKVKEWSPGK